VGRLNKDSWKGSSLRTEEVEVEELGGSVLIRELPAAVSSDLAGLVEMVQVGMEQKAKVDISLMERRQFAYGVINDDHSPQFTEAEVEELQNNHGRAFKTVVAAIDKLSGVDKEAIEKAEARFPSSNGSGNGPAVADGAPTGSGESPVPAQAGA